ncbi:MAG: sigma-70 family RNA polymerase sigma factor [Victivallaceae bacterium]
MSLTKLSDHELIAEFKNGNTTVFDELMNRHAMKLYRTVFGLISDHHDAEEVVQDAFVRAFRALDKFRGDANFNTWLHRIAVNLARNKYHWNRRRGSGQNISIYQHSDNLGDENQEQEMHLPDTSAIPDRMAQNVELEKTVTDSFDKLPDSLRETMMLRHIDEMSYEQIAEVLNCKTGTVKSRIARGREMLREILEKKDILSG